LKNPAHELALTGIMLAGSYLVYYFSQIFRVAPNIIPLAIPLALFLLKRRHALLFSLAFFLLLTISGFLNKAAGFFFLLLIPVTFGRFSENKKKKVLLIIFAGSLGFWTVYSFFSFFLPAVFTAKLSLVFLLFLLYIFAIQIYNLMLSIVYERIKNYIWRDHK